MAQLVLVVDWVLTTVGLLEDLYLHNRTQLGHLEHLVLKTQLFRGAHHQDRGCLQFMGAR